jgi:peptide deformylase
MKVKKIENSVITTEDIDNYIKAISKLKGRAFTAADVNMDKRIITIRMDDVDTEVTMVNPTILESSDKFVVYFEVDEAKPHKVRKTRRSSYLVVDTENLGKVEFQSTLKDWKSSEDFMLDLGLQECVLVQKAIDAINGVTINDPIRKYTTTVYNPDKVGRNEKILMQSEDNQMVFVKSKFAPLYEAKGYTKI